MTQLQEMIYNVIPPNLLEKENITSLLDIFFKVVDDTCKISSDIPEYVNIDTEVLSEDIMRIYLENIWSVLTDVQDSVIESGISGIQPENRVNYCYADENFNLPIQDQNYFDDETSVGLQNISVGEELIVLEYTYNGITQTNKKFILTQDTNIDTTTTIQHAVNIGALKNSESCCSVIPCAQSSIPLVPCTLDSDLSTYIGNYTGTDLASDILNQLTAPYAVTDCKSVNPNDVIATEPKYLIGDNWLYVNFYVEGDYVENNLSLNALLNIKDKITREHIWSSKDFKQNKGHAVAFYFAYNIIKEIDLDNGSTNLSSLEYIELEEVKDNNGDLVPFQYIVKSLIHKEVYNRVIYPIAHPVGFNGVYKRTLGFNFNDNFCKNVIDDYDVFFIYCINDDTYFDVREEFGKIVPSSTGNEVKYNTEIKSRFVFEQHNKTYISLKMYNGYSYNKDFDDTLTLTDNNGIVIKTYNPSCGLVPIKTRLKSTSSEIYLETIDNDRVILNTTDYTTVPNVRADKVYRIDFSNDGAEEGGFLSDQHTKIYLAEEVPNIVPGAQPTYTTGIHYHIANGLIQTYNSDNTTKQNFGNQYKFLYNGMEYKEIQLCLDKRLDWIIHMKMMDSNCIPHYKIVQEQIPVPVGYSYPVSNNLDITLDQTADKYDLNAFIQNYISANGSDFGIANHILTEQSDYLNPPGNIDVIEESLQGIDVDEDGMIDWTQYNTEVLDWGWIIGADEDGVLPPDYDDTNINTYVNANGSLNVLNWLSRTYYSQTKVSHKLGKLVSCLDEIHPEEEIRMNIMSSLADIFGPITEEILNFSISTYFTELITMGDSVDSWLITEKFAPEYITVTAPGPLNNVLPVPSAQNVDLNAFIASYAGPNLAADILDQSTAPGAVTDCNGTESIQSLAGFILDISEPGGFNVGGTMSISDFNVSDFIDGSTTEENPPGVFTTKNWNSY